MLKYVAALGTNMVLDAELAAQILVEVDPTEWLPPALKLNVQPHH